jgi:hypothetical protein
VDKISKLRTAVYGRLDYLDIIVGEADEASKSALADTVITQMTGAWRELLAAHDPDERGRCRACSPWRPLGRTGCSVWRAAHRHLITDAAERPPPAKPPGATASGGRSRFFPWRHGYQVPDPPTRDLSCPCTQENPESRGRA